MDLRKRILIIEDDEDISLSLKYNLEKEGGYAVQTAPDDDVARGSSLALLKSSRTPRSGKAI